MTGTFCSAMRRAPWDGSMGSISGGDHPLDDARMMLAVSIWSSLWTHDRLICRCARREYLGLFFHSNPTGAGCSTATIRPGIRRSVCFRQREEGKWDEVIQQCHSAVKYTTAATPSLEFKL